MADHCKKALILMLRDHSCRLMKVSGMKWNIEWQKLDLSRTEKSISMNFLALQEGTGGTGSFFPGKEWDPG